MDGSESAATRASARRLGDAVRDVKNAAADREDVVIDMRDAERMRLELLAAELKPVFDDVPQDVELFDLSVSSGLVPRLWIDAVSHVAMGRDKRTYRFVRDSRMGRVILAESSEMKPVADQVTRYLAERLVERQKLLDGAVTGHDGLVLADGLPPQAQELSTRARRGDANGWANFLSGLYLVLSGALLVVFAALMFLLWNRFDELWP